MNTDDLTSTPGQIDEAERPSEHPGHPHPHETEIIVNSRPRKVSGDTITFEQVVQLAFPGAEAEQNVIFSMTYRNAASTPHSGELAPGGSVEIKNGTIFNVTKTIQS